MGYDMARLRMSALARDLSSDETREQTLDHVVRSAVEMIGPCEAAAITLAGRRGVTVSAATSEVAVRNAELQQEIGEGPCTEATPEELVVVVPDLGRDERWPGGASRAHAELGIGSTACFPLFTNEDRVGALIMLSSRPDAFRPEDLDEGLGIAAHAAVALVAAGAIDNLRVALGSRTVIGQATGLLMAEYGVSADAAFAVLRRYSMEQNRKLVDIARELVDGWQAEPAEPSDAG
jgi:transcriptional regulator with GAF, ATPase, and Fis domain